MIVKRYPLKLIKKSEILRRKSADWFLIIVRFPYEPYTANHLTREF
ncbi:hypothetical protein Cabys_2756 [Caldithrix abyssi DSM 13497]|uniref:Uncharacterized protein n=1 Tax=Caldithrix abyssi DSM 13497 TaxID=880073 RepID=A0A1J1CC76_CALAY|nr:hypothetical protein Cabys_2756 [Caldithrix abyssi DSM 13497]